MNLFIDVDKLELDSRRMIEGSDRLSKLIKCRYCTRTLFCNSFLDPKSNDMVYVAFCAKWRPIYEIVD